MRPRWVEPQLVFAVHGLFWQQLDAGLIVAGRRCVGRCRLGPPAGRDGQLEHRRPLARLADERRALAEVVHQLEQPLIAFEHLPLRLQEPADAQVDLCPLCRLAERVVSLLDPVVQESIPDLGHRELGAGDY